MDEDSLKQTLGVVEGPTSHGNATLGKVPVKDNCTPGKGLPAPHNYKSGDLCMVKGLYVP